MATKSGKNKEVGKHPPKGTVEESFGGAPGSVEIDGGTMHLFGHKIGTGIWPKDPIGPNVKTGYPRNRSMGGSSKA